jgi:xylulokinase
VCYRAGDQPSNDYSLNVLEPGEIGATAGTSGVVFGVTEKTEYDSLFRVNASIYVNNENPGPRFGFLLCVNGTGSLNSWLRKNVFEEITYEQINAMAGEIKFGSDNLLWFSFGNEAERVLRNEDPGA